MEKVIWKATQVAHGKKL